jgi:hypothetical protein
MLTITSDSHLDHNLTLGHLRAVLAHYGARDSFFVGTLTLEPSLPELPCGLRGPAVGMDPVPNAHVAMQARPGRSYPSRVILPAFMPEHRWGLTSPLLTVVAGPHGGLPCVLFTAYGGPLAPREPGDPSLPESERAASEAFWAEHALVPL